ncbi:MAG: hypothetical protein RR071_06490 [Lachnospiraceae bacterium]
MSQLSALNDLLNEEDLLVKKFKMLAEQTQDTQIKSSFTEISSKHQGHFNDLYSHFN